MIDVRADELQPGDRIAGWERYTVVKFSAHPSRPNDGKVVLRPNHPTTFRTCWTPKRSDEVVRVLDRQEIAATREP